MIYSYPGLFMNNKDGLTVTFKDFNNATTQGKNLNDCIFMGQELLATMILDYKEKNVPLPVPSGLDCYDIKKEVEELNVYAGKHICDEKDCFVNYVSVDPEKHAKLYFNKMDKKTLTIPHWLNVKAQEKGINFSKTLTDALISILKV